MANRIFQRGGFDAPNVTRGGNEIRFTNSPFGFRSNDDTFDILSLTDLLVDFDAEGGGEPGGVHPDHFPMVAEGDYAIRLIGDSRLINPPIVDAFNSDLTEPGLYPGYDKSRIIFKLVVSGAPAVSAISINRSGDTYRVDYGINDTAARLAGSVSEDVATVLDCSRLIPKGIKSVGIFRVDFETGLGGAIQDSLQMTVNGSDTVQLVQQDINMTQVVSSSKTAVFHDIMVNALSEVHYQVTDSANNTASIYCFGYERSIGRDD